MLLKNNFDHSYVDINFTVSVSKGKLVNISNAVSLIIQQIEKAIQLIIIKEQKLYAKSKLLIIESAKKNILNKNTNFFSLNSHSTTVDFGSPIHEYSLFTLICQKCINIRMLHYEKRFNMREVFKNFFC